MYKKNFVNHSKNYASLMKNFQNCHKLYIMSALNCCFYIKSISLHFGICLMMYAICDLRN